MICLGTTRVIVEVGSGRVGTNVTKGGIRCPASL